MDLNKNSIEFLNLFKDFLYHWLNFSSIISNKDNLLNYYSSALDNCFSTLTINYKPPINDDFNDDNYVVGINCFDELLLRSEFISYARDNF